MVGGFANFFTVKMTNASPNYHFVCGTNSYSNFVAQLEGIKRKKKKKKKTKNEVEEDDKVHNHFW